MQRNESEIAYATLPTLTGTAQERVYSRAPLMKEAERSRAEEERKREREGRERGRAQSS